MKKIAAFLFLLLLAGFAWRLYQKIAEKTGGARKGGPPSGVAVALHPILIEPIRDIRVYSGTLIPREQFVVAPKVAGRLEKLLVNIGDPVQNGDLVAVLDSQEYLQQAEQARAELEVAAATVAEVQSARDVAARELARVKELVKEKVASEAELDQTQARFLAAQARHEVALAQIKQREALLKAAEIRLSYTRIHAAWEQSDGTRIVGERFVDVGAMLKANDPVVSVLDIDTVIAVVSVIERDYPHIQPRQPAELATDAFPGKTFPGIVTRKAPLLRESSRQARVEIEIANPNRLLVPGLFVRAEIPFAEHPAATVAPAAALVQRDGQSGLFLADRDALKVRFVPVTIGITDGNRVEITAPALHGEAVVLGQHLLEDGSSIILHDPKQP